MPRDSKHHASRWAACVAYASLLLLQTPALSARARTALPKPASNSPVAQWIWRSSGEPAPRNTFTYFRKKVFLPRIPTDATLHFAADSNAHLWVNEYIVQRKMTRYFEQSIRTEAIDVRRYLHPGWNTVVVLHHNWGPIITFQRSGNVRAGVYLRGSWINTDDTWTVLPAPEFEPSMDQITGVTGDARIRFPEVIDGTKVPDRKLWTAGFDDHTWARAAVVQNGPWPAAPLDVETPPLDEHSVTPIQIIAAGNLQPNAPLAHKPIDIAQGISHATYTPVAVMTTEARHLLSGGAFTVMGKAGESKYVMVDFGEPIHGFPQFSLASSTAGALIDLGYGEASFSQYSGRTFVRPDGWIDPERVVGHGYADRYKTGTGVQHVEMPDERTARWFSLLVHFPADGEVHFSNVGFISSGSPTPHIGRFTTGDPEIDHIMQLAMRHAKVAMSDVFVDTPGREDGMWIEDARPRAELAARWFGDTRMRELFLRIVAESQRSNGNFHPFPPASYPIGPQGFYDWTVEWAGALYDQYQWSGNVGDVTPYWSQLTRLWTLELAQMDTEGLWRSDKVLADIRVGDHPKNDSESSSIVQAQLISRLRESIELAKATGHAAKAEEWATALDTMERGFQRFHRTEAMGGVPAHVPDVVSGPASSPSTRGYSQAAQVMAMLAGLIPQSMLRADLDFAFTAPDGSPHTGVTRWNNPTYAYRTLRVLSDTGHADLAVRHLRERYSPYLAGNPRNHIDLSLQGPLGGPLPEYFVSRDDMHLGPGELDTAQPIDETGSHGWGAVPLLWAHDTLLGVRIATAGGAHLTIAPQAGGLPHVSGTTYTPHGLVSVDWRPRLQKLTLRVPKNTSFTLTLPGELVTSNVGSLPVSCKVTDAKTLECSGSSLLYTIGKTTKR
jgi:hypothetical protein